MRENYTLPRLYVQADLAEGANVDLMRDQAHYLGAVIRKNLRDEVRIFNGQNGEWRAEITEIGKRKASLKVLTQLRPHTAAPDIWLCFAPVRKHRTAFILEKATELGVGTLQPVQTERTQFPKLNMDKARAQIIEAAEQTERLDLPDLAPLVRLSALLADWPTERTLFFADEAGADEAGDAAPALDALQKQSGEAAILIGPEGGFSEAEREILRAKPYVVPIALGPRILRADTAALAMLTLWQAVNGDW